MASSRVACDAKIWSIASNYRIRKFKSCECWRYFPWFVTKTSQSFMSSSHTQVSKSHQQASNQIKERLYLGMSERIFGDICTVAATRNHHATMHNNATNCNFADRESLCAHLHRH